MNVEADPGRITDIVAHVGDNILFDRENRLPNGRWIREDLARWAKVMKEAHVAQQ